MGERSLKTTEQMLQRDSRKILTRQMGLNPDRVRVGFHVRMDDGRGVVQNEAVRVRVNGRWGRWRAVNDLRGWAIAYGHRYE